MNLQYYDIVLDSDIVNIFKTMILCKLLNVTIKNYALLLKSVVNVRTR